MKSQGEVLADIARYLGGHWAATITGAAVGRWPHNFSLGRLSSAQLRPDGFLPVQRWALAWRQWAAQEGLDLLDETRRVGTTIQKLPTHVSIPDIDVAARVAGREWQLRMERGRARNVKIQAEFAAAPTARVLAAVDGYTNTDFDLLCASARWFQRHPTSWLSPRQVPIEGLHSKWLNSRRPVIAMLAGLDDLGLVEPRAVAVEFTYLDPDHRAAGGRVHDSVIPGDFVKPAYDPCLVVITENKDSAILFPATPGAIAVQGGGKAGPSLIGGVGWLCGAADIVYWGDLDSAGFEIVNSYRARGVLVRTILMDLDTLDRFRRFAATTDAKGRPLMRDTCKPLVHLTDAERAAYEAITDAGGTWPIRVEQERIPLDVAVEALGRA